MPKMNIWIRFNIYSFHFCVYPESCTFNFYVTDDYVDPALLQSATSSTNSCEYRLLTPPPLSHNVIKNNKNFCRNVHQNKPCFAKIFPKNNTVVNTVSQNATAIFFMKCLLLSFKAPSPAIAPIFRLTAVFGVHSIPLPRGKK